MATDRHARSARADNDPRRRPSDGYRVHSDARFRRVVLDAIASLPDRLADPLDQARIVVVEVPPPPMVGADGDMMLAEFDGRVLTVYRRPLEMRAESRVTLEETVMLAVGLAVARRSGWDEDIEGLFGG